MQLAFTATLLQLFVCVKLLLATPLMVTDGDGEGIPVPLLLRVTGTGVELVPVIVGGKLTTNSREWNWGCRRRR